MNNIESNENKKDDLNYKRAYYYMFNNITEIIRQLIVVQKKAEDICIADPTPYESGFEPGDALDVIKEIVDTIQSGEQEQKERI